MAPVVEKYPPGLPIVKQGQPITEGQLSLLKDEHRAYRKSLRTADHVRRATSLLLISLLLSFVLVLYVARFQPALAGSLSRVLSICTLVLVTLAVGLLLSRSPWYALLVPMTVTAMVLTIAYNPPFALVMSFSLALMASLVVTGFVVGRWVKLYPIEAAIVNACRCGQGGTGDVAILTVIAKAVAAARRDLAEVRARAEHHQHGAGERVAKLHGVACSNVSCGTSIMSP